MVRKPGRMYRNLAKRAYTRREYMGGVRYLVVQFDMGNLTEEFPRNSPSSWRRGARSGTGHSKRPAS